ncbi:MAG TPA: discoidin domain-containing protein, partial [Pyrinomonadaceae bacterium]|nr:discoidin domain-containing protein [Pyrinomonadaceae bacterium]
MKQCPQCNGRYADDSLKFCLQDGSLLAPVSDEPSSRDSDATLIYGSLDSNQPQVVQPEISNHTTAYRAQPTVAHSAVVGSEYQRGSGHHSTSRLLVGGVLAIAVLLLVSVGIGAAFLFRQSAVTEPRGPNARAAESPSPISNQGTSTTKPLSSSTAIESDQDPKSPPLKIKATASSVRYAVQSNTYDPSNAIDGNKGTAWIEGVDGPGWGEWIRFDFDREINLHRVLILPGYFKSPAIWARNNRISGA